VEGPAGLYRGENHPPPTSEVARKLRPECLAIAVADPRIGSAAAGLIEEMMIINLFCKLVSALAKHPI
jgi:hypothetical protein